MVIKFVAFPTIVGRTFVATQFRSNEAAPTLDRASDYGKSTEAASSDFRAIVQPQFDEAAARSIAAISTQIESVEDFFDEAKRVSGKLAADALRWMSIPSGNRIVISYRSVDATGFGSGVMVTGMILGAASSVVLWLRLRITLRH